uniref:Retrovirus-related Pol polyprotein from transposon TNT 1-94 n=1 Tax=Tanacetum cinerariifolium TaxID=118510 RepID=A0A6L2LIF9_TANCI|nr:hypothetical protein [Tanacetum cinerariifolium]
MQKNLDLILKYFKNIYKPTNNNLKTSSNSRNKNVNTTLRYKNDNQSGQFGNQRTMNVAAARENKAKKDTDEEIDEQELEAHYSYMEKIQEVPTTDTCNDSEPLEKVQNDTGCNVFANDLQHSKQCESFSNTCIVETDDSNVIHDSPDMCDDDIQNDQNDVESDDERVALANLISNLELDVDENKNIQKQLKKANTTLAQKLKGCKTILTETSKTLGESISVWDSYLAALQNKQTEFKNYKAFNDRTVDYDKLKRKLNETLRQLSQKDIEIKEGLKTKAYEISMVKEKHDELIKQSLLTKSHYEGLVKKKTKDMEILIQTCLMPLALKTQNDSFIFVHELKQEMHVDLKYVESFEKEIDELESDKAEFSNMYGMILQECVSNEVMCTYLLSLSDLDALAELQCLYLHKVKECECLAQKLSKQTESVSKEVHTELLKRFAKVEKHSISLEITLQKFDSDHFACVTKMLNDVNARTKKPNVVPISTRKPKGHANKSVATPHKKKVALKSTTQKPKSYYRMLYEKTSKAWKWWIEQKFPSGYKCVPKTKMQWVPKARNENVQKRIIQLILFIVDSGCMKHMTGNLKLLCNFVEKFLGTVRFGNDQLAPILGYEDLVQGNIMINRVITSKDSITISSRDLQGNDLLTGNRGSDLHTISLQESTSSTLRCLMGKASPTQAWLWHQRRSHLNFDYINLLSKKDVVIGLPKLKFVKDQLCSSCELSKAKRSSFKSKVVPSLKGRLNLLHMDLCGPMRVASINGKKYILMKEKRDPCILVGYSTQSKGYRVYNKRTRLIVESIHIYFDEIKEMFKTSVANDTSGLVLQRQKASDYDNSNPVLQVSTSLLLLPKILIHKTHNLQRIFNLHQHHPLLHMVMLRKTKKIKQKKNTYKTMNLPILSVHRYKKLLSLPRTTLVYVAQPDGFVDPDYPEKVYRLRKALYRLKLAPRVWYDELSKFLTSKGFTKGLQIHQSPRGIFINQAKYALKILHKHGMEKGQSIGITMATKPKLDADLSRNPVDQTDYHSKIGSLMYLRSSRPDIVQAYPNGSSFALTAFSNVDHAECIDTRKSASGGIQFLGDKLVSWISKKQDCTAMSSAEAEYVALSVRCA